MAERLAEQLVVGDAVARVRRVRRPKSLTTLVVDQLRQMIVTGEIDLGEQLSENALAERLGVSRTPVREAFMRLAHEQLVEVRPQRGTFVFTCTADEVREICELRAILEAGALRLAAARDRPGVVAALAASADAAEAALLTSPQAYQPYDSEFHESLVAAAGNSHLTEAYARISGRVCTLRWRYIVSLEQVRESQRAHRAVIQHIATDDDDAAEAALRAHVHKSYRVFRGIAEQVAAASRPLAPLARSTGQQ